MFFSFVFASSHRWITGCELWVERSDSSQSVLHRQLSLRHDGAWRSLFASSRSSSLQLRNRPSCTRVWRAFSNSSILFLKLSHSTNRFAILFVEQTFSLASLTLAQFIRGVFAIFCSGFVFVSFGSILICFEGRSSLQLGLGEVRAKKHIVGPRAISSFAARFVRSVSGGTAHVAACLAPQVKEEEEKKQFVLTSMVWVFCSMLFASVWDGSCWRRSECSIVLW